MNQDKRKPKYINEDGYEVYQSEDGKYYTMVSYDEFELHSKGFESRTGIEWKKYYKEWKENYPKEKQDSSEYRRMCKLFEQFIEKAEKQNHKNNR